MGKTRTFSVLAGVLLAAAAAVATPTAAQAVKQECDNIFALCMWHNQNYGGTRFTPADSVDHLGGDSDEAHSVWNHTTVAWVLFDDDDFDTNDRHFCIPAGVSHPNLGAAPYKFGDKITSVQRLETNNCGNLPQIAQG